MANNKKLKSASEINQASQNKKKGQIVWILCGMLSQFRVLNRRLEDYKQGCITPLDIIMINSLIIALNTIHSTLISYKYKVLKDLDIKNHGTS